MFKLGQDVEIIRMVDGKETYVRAKVVALMSAGFIEAKVDHPEHEWHGRNFTVSPEFYREISEENKK